jgi:hypothetical protein
MTDLGYMYTWIDYFDEQANGHWAKYRITKVTKKCVFIEIDAR